MKVWEFIDKVNDLKAYAIWQVEDEIDDRPKLVAEGLDFDEHRWYSTSVSVYECEDGFVGVWGCSQLKSETMDWEDAGVICKASEYVEKQTVTYVPK